MKILIIGPFPKPINGCSLANEVLLKQLTLKEDVSVDRINTNTNNISSENVGKFSFGKVFSFFKSYKLIFSIGKFDIIYTTPGQTFYGIAKYIPFYFCCLLLRKPYVIHIHGNHLGNEYIALKGIKKKLFSYYIKRASAGIVLSNSLRNNFNNLLHNDKVFEVENFAENELIQNTFLIKKKDKLRLVYLSNLMEEKGVIDFLDCLILLKKKGIDFIADIAGKIEDESEVLISKKFEDLNGFINYHGVIFGEAKVKLLEESNVFILPTYYRMEGQPISLIEAMATGNIILTTSFSGIPDIITSDNGYFVEAKNPESIFDALVNINDNLEKQIDQFSSSNIEYVKSYFTESQFADKILNVVNQVYK